ncbi:polysaccharide deacetylase family protein [Mesorhizobium sp. M0854]|uniref:polysaccharide deacetylase family protein n=1 Tax=Mesorhizobium sp. M0854 TaxID=2957013 RepID=UPI0033374EE3
MIDGGEAIRKLALNLARYSGLAPLAKPFIGGLGAILMLHRVTATPEKPNGVNRHLNIAPGFLDTVIADMKANGYSFVTLDEAIERIKAGDKDGQFATITADDAYRDNMTEALPVLEKHGAPITIYVAPGLIDGAADLWWDVVEDIVNARDRLTLTTPDGPGDNRLLESGKKGPGQCAPARSSDAEGARAGPACGVAGSGALERHRVGWSAPEHADELGRDPHHGRAPAGGDRRT